MILDPSERTAISALGWVDRGAIRILDLATGQSRSVSIDDARYVTLHAGRDGHFAVVHHHDGHRLLITTHTFAEPEAVQARCEIVGHERRLLGKLESFTSVPRHYVAYLVQPAWCDYALISLDARNSVGLQTFEWYDESFDKGYQGVVGVAEVQDTGLLLVSVQRSSTLILYDPAARKKMGEVVLGHRSGNPVLHKLRTRREMLAIDYDTIVTVDADTLRVRRRRQLQPSAAGVGQFVGQLALDANEARCVVARPYSGDVVGLDPVSLRITHRARFEGQPLDVVLLRDGTVFARDWKTGHMTRDRLRRTWQFW